MKYDEIMKALWSKCVDINNDISPGDTILHNNINYKVASPATVLGYTVSVEVGAKGQTITLLDLSKEIENATTR